MLRRYNGFITTSILSALLLLTATFTFGQKQTVTTTAPADGLVAMRTIKEKSNVAAGNPYSAARKFTEPKFNSYNTPAKPRSQTNTSGTGWEFSFAPYLYMTGLSGTVGARGRTAAIDLSFGDVVSNLDLGLMGTFEARKGKIVILNDMVWTKMSEKRDTPGGLYSTAKIGVNLFSWSPELGYRLYDGKGGSFDFIGGIRLTSVENNLNFTSGTLPGFDVSARKTWAAPIVGGHGVANLSSKFFLSTVFDIGGGFGTHFTGQFYGGAGYKVTPKIALIGGYRYLNNNFSDSEGFTFDAAMNGILLGAKFKF